MNPKHFKELLETVCVTTNSTKIQVADYLHVTPTWLSFWQRNGVPRTKAPMVLSRLKDYVFEKIGG